MEPSDWQRRYEASLAAERAKSDETDVGVVETVAMEVSAWLPGVIGAAVAVAAAIVVLVRRRIPRRPS